MTEFETLKANVLEELKQRTEEGCDVSCLAERCESASTVAELNELYPELRMARTREDFPYVEPSHLAGIRRLRPAPSERRPVKVDDALFDRIHGAWLGRIAGCMLGKPVEGRSRDTIRKYLEARGEYPLADYIPPSDGKEVEGVDWTPYGGVARGEWDHAKTDDDTNYTVINLKIMEECGLDFTTADVGRTWLRDLPFYQVCTAEQRAYLSLANGVPADRTAVHDNPAREIIGAQIRADYWGYCAPGWPEKAAEFAYRDARLSHVKNGIYGEMFCAAAISAALVTNDVSEIIAAGLNQIPFSSRLAETVSDCLEWRQECRTWEEANDRMSQTYYGKYSWAHTNNNLAVVLIAMLYGWPDYEKVVSISVMQGLDTDCNGATAGSIIGAALGAKALPTKWIKPLGGKLDTCIIGMSIVDIEDLARRTMKQVERVLAL